MVSVAVVGVAVVVIVDVFVTDPVLAVLVLVVLLRVADVVVGVMFVVVFGALVAVVLVVVIELLTVVVVGITIVAPRHWHTWQYCVFIFGPQQSPLSKLHCTILLISSQYPSPTHKGFGQPKINRLRFVLNSVFDM